MAVLDRPDLLFKSTMSRHPFPEHSHCCLRPFLSTIHHPQYSCNASRHLIFLGYLRCVAKRFVSWRRNGCSKTCRITDRRRQSRLCGSSRQFSGATYVPIGSSLKIQAPFFVDFASLWCRRSNISVRETHAQGVPFFAPPGASQLRRERCEDETCKRCVCDQHLPRTTPHLHIELRLPLLQYIMIMAKYRQSPLDTIRPAK